MNFTTTAAKLRAEAERCGSAEQRAGPLRIALYCWQFSRNRGDRFDAPRTGWLLVISRDDVASTDAEIAQIRQAFDVPERAEALTTNRMTSITWGPARPQLQHLVQGSLL
jgi:hypothetical protein